MSGKHLDQWSGRNQSYDYDYDSDSDDYSYNAPSQEVNPQRFGYLPSVFLSPVRGEDKKTSNYEQSWRSQDLVRGEDNKISNYEQSWRSHDRNRQTGTYKTQSTKEVASHGDTFKERSTGRVGSKDEFKNTSTYRVGDKSGYSEYQYQERYRQVDFVGNDGSSSGGSGSKEGYINYSTSKKYLK